MSPSGTTEVAGNIIAVKSKHFEFHYHAFDTSTPSKSALREANASEYRRVLEARDSGRQVWQQIQQKTVDIYAEDWVRDLWRQHLASLNHAIRKVLIELEAIRRESEEAQSGTGPPVIVVRERQPSYYNR
ncbi:MAG: hypothetical protein L6R39_006385 [Caloplaca ligustica]|nr:MAG: hypothetical protein L6R39_006385 [Caloplaca ligustica]